MLSTQKIEIEGKPYE